MSALPQIQVCEIIPLPGDIPRFREALAAVNERCRHRGIDGFRQAHAREIVRDVMCAGGSAGSAVEQANTYLKDPVWYSASNDGPKRA